MTSLNSTSPAGAAGSFGQATDYTCNSCVLLAMGMGVDSAAIVARVRPAYPSAEHLLAVAPAWVAAKQRPGFPALWNAVVSGPQPALFALAGQAWR